MKKIALMILCAVFALGIFSGCDSVSDTTETDSPKAEVVENNGPEILPCGIRLGMDKDEVEDQLGKSLGVGESEDDGDMVYTISTDEEEINSYYGTKWMERPTYMLSFDDSGCLKTVLILSKYTSYSTVEENFTAAYIDYLAVVETIESEIGIGTEEDSMSPDFCCTWEEDDYMVVVCTVTSAGDGYSGVTIIVK